MSENDSGGDNANQHLKKKTRRPLMGSPRKSPCLADAPTGTSITCGITRITLSVHKKQDWATTTPHSCSLSQMSRFPKLNPNPPLQTTLPWLNKAKKR